MPVYYNSNILTPAPLISVQKNFIRNQQNAIIGQDYLFTLNGTIDNTTLLLDSPGISGIYNFQMEGVLQAQKYIESTFTPTSGYALLQIQSPSLASSGILTYAVVESVDFGQGTWVDRDTYTVTLRSKGIEGVDAFGNLSEMNESWSVTENEDTTYLVSHQISARGVQIYQGGIPNNPLNDAKNWVQTKSYTSSISGILTAGASGDMSLNNLIQALPASTNYWNRSQIETVDPWTFSYGLTENFIYNPSGSYREEWQGSVSYDPNPTRANVTIQGVVFGYADDIKNYGLKYSNALAQYSTVTSPNLYLRAANFVPSGYVVNVYNISKQETKEPFIGVIRYSANFLAVSGGTLVPNAVEESIEISDQGHNDVFAQIPVPGRIIGPVVQYMGTTTLPERTVSISAVIGGGMGSGISSLFAAYMQKPNTDLIIEALVPNNSGVYLLKQNTENWNPIKRQYGRVVSWVVDESYTLLPYSGLPSYISSGATGFPSGYFAPGASENQLSILLPV